LILWNQRWEYDKAPGVFFRALYALADEGLDFQVALAGKSHRQSAPEFEAARERLGTRVVHFGYADAAQYKALLRRADIVISTAIHEFFGIAIIEAIYCGCFPVLPHRLSYPEIIPPSYHKRCLYEDFEGLLMQLRWVLIHLDQARAIATELCPVVTRFDWVEMGLCYDAQFLQISDLCAQLA
jgi:glycosyltransferase involved in cell wall biosynthesis